jgi:NAD(P)-dependent dehydrogenase (short-subunit alcohol dehydrogenase family)
VSGPPLGGRVAVVTGGAGGIGRVVVERLAALGATVAVLDVSDDAHGDGRAGEAFFRHCDVTDAESVADSFDEVEGKYGPIGLFVSSAGVDIRSPFVDLSPELWRQVVDASLTGTYLGLQAAVRSMRRAGKGRAVALSSGWATKGYPNGAHYAAAKAGIEALVKSVAIEEAHNRITVNAVAPGPVRTPMVTGIENFGSWEEERSAAIPLGRIGEPGDVASIVTFLLCDESEYVTGQVWHVNGGLLMP